jgi:hypothetical protein
MDWKKLLTRQNNKNIKELDLQIGTLSKEIEKLQVDCGYEATMGKLVALTELRVKLAESIKEDDNYAIKKLDEQISTLITSVKNLERDDVYLAKLKKLDDLVKIRVDLMDSKVKASIAPYLIQGAIGLGAMILVLRYEKTEIVTSKAFGLVTRLFRG